MSFLKNVGKSISKVGKGIAKIANFVEPVVKVGLEITAALTTPMPVVGWAISSVAAVGAYGLEQYEKHESRQKNRKKERAALETANQQYDSAIAQLNAQHQNELTQISELDNSSQELLNFNYETAHNLLEQQHAQNVYDIKQHHSQQRDLITNIPGVCVGIGVAAAAGSTGHAIFLTHSAGATGKIWQGKIEVYNYDYSVNTPHEHDSSYPRPNQPQHESRETGATQDEASTIEEQLENIPTIGDLENVGGFKPALIIDKENSSIQEEKASSRVSISVNSAVVINATAPNYNIPNNSMATLADFEWIKNIKTFGLILGRSASSIGGMLGQGLALLFYPSSLADNAYEQAQLEAYYKLMANNDQTKKGNVTQIPSIPPKKLITSDLPAVPGYNAFDQDDFNFNTQNSPSYLPDKRSNIVSEYGSVHPNIGLPQNITPQFDIAISTLIAKIKADRPNAPDPDKRYYPAPVNLPGFKDAVKVKKKTDRARWQTPDKDILEWDSMHGEIEMYDKRGKHLWAFNPYNGEKISEAVPGRKIEV